MVEDKKKIVMVVIIVVCLGLAAVIAVINFGGGGSGGSTSGGTTGSTQMLCVNPDCGHMYELTPEERRRQMFEGGRMMMRQMGPPVFTCPQCGEESAYQANKCPKCETVFVPDWNSDDFTDRCPECGYSAIEEKRQNQ
jgi:DNA-directed RNA polymerase subunit M/transcription elongation factor TFIIS